MLVIGVLWIASVLTIDRKGSSFGTTTQVVIGVFTWCLLFAVGALESRHVRAQVAVVVVYATIIEYVFSGWLHTYVYRLDHVPLYVPPGHGLVYGAAITMARTPTFKRYSRHLVAMMLVGAGGWAIWGVTLSPRSDWLGFFWFACMVLWVRLSKTPLVFVGAFIVVSYLEIMGTSMGVWAWGTHDPVWHYFTIGNPPSGAAGGYCWFDTAALLLSPYLLRKWDAWRKIPIEDVYDHSRGQHPHDTSGLGHDAKFRSPRKDVESGFVEQPVAAEQAASATTPLT